MTGTELEILARGAALSCLLLLLFRTLHSYRDLAAARYFALFGTGLAAYVALPLLPPEHPLIEPLIVLAITVPPSFWLFCDTLFHEPVSRAPGAPVRAALICAYLALALASHWWVVAAPATAGEKLLFYGTYVGRLLFLLLALRSVVSTWRDDLVNARRTLRGLMLAVSTAYIAMVLLVEVILANDLTPAYLDVANAVSLAVALLSVTAWFLVGAPDALFVTGAASNDTSDGPADPLTHSEREWLARLETAMREDRIYREPDLGIRSLADALQIPEHLLRRLINRQLGYRNFRQYLNAHRLREVEARLRDPAEERLPILTIALDAGFASIAPFNRVFRETHGVTPTEFRRQALSGG